MTTYKKTVGISALIITLGSAVTVRAQYHATGEDGITASPRVRQMLGEHPVSTRVEASEKSECKSLAGDGIAASPKVRAKMEERNAVLATVGKPVSTALSTTHQPNDGIAASPKLRAQMAEHSVQSPGSLAASGKSAK